MAPHGPQNSALVAAAALACLVVCLLPPAASTQTNAPRRLAQTPEHATSLNPTLSGDGRRVVFETTADLTGNDSPPRFRAVAADLANAPPSFTALAPSRAPAPAVSQDGSRVAFSSVEDLTGGNADRNPEIFLAENGLLRQLTDTSPSDPAARLDDGNFRPSISDDGRLVAFASNRDLVRRNADGNTEIFLLDTRSDAFAQLTDTHVPTRHADAKVSGDGSRVVFVRETAQNDDAPPRRDLVIHELAPARERVVAENFAGLALTPGRAISDDGLRVVFSAADSRGATQVFLFDGRNDGALRRLTQLGTRQTDVPLNPSLSGDGSRVTFATRRSVVGGNSDASAELYLYDIPTRVVSRLTDAPREATAEVISSLDDAGASVAFSFSRVLAGPVSSEEFEDNSEIFFVNPPPRAPHSTELQLVHAATHGREPSPEKVFAPGQIAHARGTNLSLVSRQSARLPGGDFPRSLASVTVTVNNRPARIYYVSPAQVNFQFPEETELGAAEVVVCNHDGFESRAVVQIATAAPGVFTERGDGTGAAVALDAATQLRAPFDPVDRENNPRTLVIFATGVARARAVSVSLGGRDAPVENVVHSTELPGLDEIHVRLRHSLAGAGAVACTVTADGRAGNPTIVQFAGTRRPVRLTLTPGSAALGVGRALKLVATVFDAEGGEIADAPVVFTSSDDRVATVEASGLIRATGEGTAKVTAKVATAVGELSASSQLSVHPLSLTLNEVLADPPDGQAGDANRDGVRSASQDEFVEIVNASARDIDLGGYSVVARNTSGADVVRHVFAPGTVIVPGTAVVVFGGAEPAFDPHDAAFGGALVLTASTGALSLPNGAGTVTLRSPTGETVEQLSYGGSNEPDADRNQSLTRSPDLAGDFTQHLDANAQRAYSPGTRLDGVTFEATAPVSRVEIEPREAAAEIGARRQFAARAFDAQGREMSNVIFRWESSDAAVATVDQSGLATALSAGSAEIVARARGVASPPARLTVVPPPPRIVRVEVSPAEIAINRGGTHTFTARAFDREGRAVGDAAFLWTSSNAHVASVSASGLARGVGAGRATVTASTDDGAGGTVSASARIEVRLPVVLNELLADVPPDNSSTPSIEGDANRDGVRNADDDEFLELFNASDAPVDISGLRVFDSTATRFTFPAGATLAAGRAAIVFGGGSPPANDPAFGGALVFAASSLGLNDAGDAVTLRLAVGPDDFVVFTQPYGTAGGPAAPADQSLTRAPDSSIAAAGGPLAPHAGAANSSARPSSPGTRADGTPFESPPLTRIEISPASATLDVGESQSFTARAYADAGGSEVEVANVSFAWESGDATRAALAPSSGASTNATAGAAGSLLVRARAGGLQAEATLNVRPPPPVLSRIEVSPAAASILVGGSQQFEARAFDQFGAEMAGVPFSWSSSDPATATVDQFGLAAGLKSGSAEIRASAGGLTSPAATLAVNAPPRRVTRVELTPAGATLNHGGVQQFSARVFDAAGLEVADAQLVWSSSDAAVAAVDAAGLARGAGAGTATVRVTTSDGAGGTVAASASVEVRVPVVLTEFLADVPPDDPATPAVEGDANRDGVRDSGGDEFVELLNSSDAPVDLSGLRLSDAAGVRYTFPAGTSLAAGRAAIVFGGGNTDASDPAFGGALVLRANALSLNDGGDTLSLRLTVGAAEFVVFAQSFGSAGGPPAPADQSLTRPSDASAASGAADDFTPHLNAPEAAGRNFSPGTRADGTPFGSPPVARIEIAPASAALDPGGAQTFSARAFTLRDGAEIELANISFVWDASDPTKAALAPRTGTRTNALALAAGSFSVRARAGGLEASAALTVRPPPPVLSRVELVPQSASLAPGETRQFTARALDQFGAPFPVPSFAFASSDPSVASVAAQAFANGTSEAAATVIAHAVGAAQITATATDGQYVASATALVTVEPPPAVPAAGQVIINEALVAFASSATQSRADFVELYNTTERALDISGLVVSFRPGGNTTTVRTVALPGAVGSRATLIAPRAYFLIVNGMETFGASITATDGFDASRSATDIVAGTPTASACAAASNCFDLNGTNGGVKIEIGGAQLDGLSYQSGATAPPAPFNSFGEGPLLLFTSGATNDLIRSPNAADTNNNSADFRRNGTAADVSPKRANP